MDSKGMGIAMQLRASERASVRAMEFLLFSSERICVTFQQANYLYDELTISTFAFAVHGSF